MEIVKKIPIKSHLKKWLLLQYEVKDDAILLDRESNLSKRLYSMFEYFPVNAPVAKVFHAKSYLDVVLSDYLIRHHRTHISNNKIISFNDWVAQQFNEDLFSSLHATGRHKGDKKKAIEWFMDKYNLIEGEDINYDSLKRSYDRYQQRTANSVGHEYWKGGELVIIVNL